MGFRDFKRRLRKSAFSKILACKGLSEIVYRGYCRGGIMGFMGFVGIV